MNNHQAGGVSQVGVPIPSSQVVAPADAQAQQPDDEVGNSYTNRPTDVDPAAAVYIAEARATFPAPRVYDTIEDTEYDAYAILLSRGGLDAPWCRA